MPLTEEVRLEQSSACTAQQADNPGNRAVLFVRTAGHVGTYSGISIVTATAAVFAAAGVTSGRKQPAQRSQGPRAKTDES